MQPRRIAILLLLLGLLVAAAMLDPVHDAARRVLDAASAVIREHEVAGLALFALLSAVSAVAFFFSTTVLVPVAVEVWGKSGTMALLWGSWMLGAMVSYWIGSRPGRRLARWLVPGGRVARYEQKISAKANFPLVLLFQLAVPSEIPGYVLGALRYSFGRYFAARALAELPFAAGAVLLGDSFVRRQYGPLVAIAVAGIALSVVSVYLLHRRLDR